MILNTHLTTYGYSLNKEGVFVPYNQKKGLRKKYLYVSDEKTTSFVVDSQGFFLIDATKRYDSFEEAFNHFINTVSKSFENGEDWDEDDQDCQYIDFTNVLSEEIHYLISILKPLKIHY